MYSHVCPSCVFAFMQVCMRDLYFQSHLLKFENLMMHCPFQSSGSNFNVGFLMSIGDTRLALDCCFFLVCVYMICVFCSDGDVSGASDGSGEGAADICQHSGTNRRGSEMAGQSGIKCTGQSISANNSAYLLALSARWVCHKYILYIWSVCVFVGSIRR